MALLRVTGPSSARADRAVKQISDRRMMERMGNEDVP